MRASSRPTLARSSSSSAQASLTNASRSSASRSRAWSKIASTRWSRLGPSSPDPSLPGQRARSRSTSAQRLCSSSSTPISPSSPNGRHEAARSPQSRADASAARLRTQVAASSARPSSKARRRSASDLPPASSSRSMARPTSSRPVARPRRQRDDRASDPDRVDGTSESEEPVIIRHGIRRYPRRLRSSDSVQLLRPQRPQRIGPERPADWTQTGAQRRQQEERGDGEVCQRIGGLHAVELAAQKSAGR